jgi:hypothetical protein
MRISMLQSSANINLIFDSTSKKEEKLNIRSRQTNDEALYQ